jgi:hypothetical protein
MKKYLILLFLWIVFLPTILCATELPMTEQLFFKSQLKEYACKIIDPSLRHENSQLATLDVKNLQDKIFRKLTSSEEHLKVFKKFIIENIWTAKVLSSFKKDLLDKQKFESLNNIPHEIIDFSDFNNFDFPSSSTSKTNIILIDKFLYKSSFNSLTNTTKFSEKHNNIYASASKNLEQEYNEIYLDRQKITDEETLKKYGPSVIERSEKILYGNDDSLRLDYALSLIDMAGVCRTLLQYGTDLPKPTLRKYLLDYCKSIYESVPLFHYKYAAVLGVLNLLEADKKYDDMLAYARKVKNEIFEQLIIDYKRDIVFKICYIIVYLCEPKQEYLEIGKENCYQLNNLIDISDGPYYPTPEHKRMSKLTYTFYLTSKLYAKYNCYNEEMNELDIILNSPPPTISEFVSMHKELVNNAKTRKAEIAPFVIYIKTDKEKIISDLGEKTTNLKVEVVNGNGQPVSYSISAISDNPEIAEILGGPVAKRKNKITETFSIRFKNFGACNIKITATGKSTFAFSTLVKTIPLHLYKIHLSEASFVSNGSTYIKLKEIIKTGVDTYIDQEITSPEYKNDGTNLSIIKPVALIKNTTPDFNVKFKILFQHPISIIKIRIWARADNEEVPPVEDFIEVKPDNADPSLFSVKCKMLKDFSNNNICSKQIYLNYQISTIVYQNESGTQTDNCALAGLTHDKIPFYYSWKKPLNEPVYERIAYFASNWATNADGEKNIVDELYKGWTLKKAPEHEYNFSATKIIKNWDDEEDALTQIITEEYGQCRVMSYFFKNLCNFHGINIKIVIFTLAKKKENDYYKKGEYYEFLVHNWGIGKKIKKRGPNYDVYEVLDSNPKWTYPFVYSQTYTNNNTLAYYQKASWNSSGWQCDYWCFTNHVVCILDNQWFYDASFDNLPFNFTYPGNNSTSIYDLKDKNDPIVKYIKMNVSFLGGVFDVLNDSIIKNFDNVYIPISKIINEQCQNSNEINFYKLEINWKEL